MNTEKSLKIVMLLSLLPLLFSLYLSVYFWTHLPDLSVASYKFSRLNSYIYAHSYGVILLSASCGISLGLAIVKGNNGHIVLLNFLLIWLAWLSYSSFADWRGMSFLVFCWIVFFMTFIQFKDQTNTPGWFYQASLKFHTAAIIIMSLITALNQ